MTAGENTQASIGNTQNFEDGIASKKAVLAKAANELVFGVVGHVGSGPGTIADQLDALLSDQTLTGGAYDTEILHARPQIEAWAKTAGRDLPATAKSKLDTSIAYQELGDDMRRSTKDNAAVARALVQEVRLVRAKKRGVEVGDGAVAPDGTRRAYILESLRHPDEVKLLRHIYQDAFILIGVVCDTEKRIERISKKYDNAGRNDAIKFMQRDADGGENYGQKVAETFHLSDFFIDNSPDRENKDGTGSEDFKVSDDLSRLLRIILRDGVVRPESAETAMHDAYSAGLRSACLSRQVGAALMDREGNIIATGSNEVPKAGGGVYGEGGLQVENGHDEGDERYEHRCAFRKGGVPYCSNTTQQNELVRNLIQEIPELRNALPERALSLPTEIRDSGIGDLLEFSRAVHAEMDALLSAGRTGASTVGSRLFVTTFPCHYCARHIVSAGVDEVQYIEPYPKSQAAQLHADSIETEPKGWMPPSAGGRKVLFHPFVGVAPRLYRRAFLKDRRLKDKNTGLMVAVEPDWSDPWHLGAAAYTELEALLAKSAP